MNSKLLMTMESANGQKSSTLGVVQNLPFDLGPFTIYLQAQVVESAPYECLLGMPFFRFTQAVARYYIDGDQDLTLINVNTGDVTTLPTSARKPPNERRTTVPVGFFERGF